MNSRINKRVKTSENDEAECQHQFSKQKDEDKKNEDEKEGRKRTLSISNFEPVQPGRKLLNSEVDKRNYRKGTVDMNQDPHNFDKNFMRGSVDPLRTPQPDRSDDMIINQLVYK